MVYTDPVQVRRLVGLPFDPLDPNYVSDSVLSDYIELAQILFLDSITVLKRDAILSGSIDGSNVDFETPDKFIADRNFDKMIDSSDIDVYGWTDPSDPKTKTLLNVDQVFWKEGLVVLSSPPDPSYKVLTADYRHYLFEPDMDLFSLAVSYLTGVLYFRSEYMEIPESYKLGAATYRITSPAQRSYQAYLETLNIIRRKQIFRGMVYDVVRRSV